MKEFLLFFLFLFCSLAVNGEEWNQFRGPGGLGISKQKISTSWNQDSVIWKTKLPGLGQSSISYAKGRLFLSAGSKGGNHRVLLCYNEKNGRLIWKREIKYKGVENIHRMNGWATPTPATFGNRVVAFFGPAGLHCFDLDGNKMWSLDLGDFPGNWGVAASPIIYNGIVYQNCDSMGPSRIVAISLTSGQILWETQRVEKPRGGWSTPIVIQSGNRIQLALNGEFGIRGYDLKNGKELWFCRGFNGRGSPVPFFLDDMVFVVNGKPGDLYAVSTLGQGDVTKTQLKWHSRRNGGRDLPSPAVIDGIVLVTSMSGVITAYDAENGKTLWIDRLYGAFSGSPLIANNLYYLQSENGSTYVINPNRKKLEILSVNELTKESSEVFRATLSPIGGKIFTRSLTTLYCIH